MSDACFLFGMSPSAASPDGFPQDFLKGVALSVWQVCCLACASRPALPCASPLRLARPPALHTSHAHPPTQNSMDAESNWTFFARRKNYW